MLHGARLTRPPPQRFDLRSLNVLVVDDSQPSLDIILQILLGFGVRSTKACRTVADAMAHLDIEAVDLVIADGEMPEQDGFDLTGRVRANQDGPNFTVPVLLASGYTPLSKIERARDIGANMVVLKPLVPQVLLSRIEWMAKTPREFIVSPDYCGPDRRIKNIPLPIGAEERRADAMRLMTQPDRELSQGDIDSLFD